MLLRTLEQWSFHLASLAYFWLGWHLWSEWNQGKRFTLGEGGPSR